MASIVSFNRLSLADRFAVDRFRRRSPKDMVTDNVEVLPPDYVGGVRVCLKSWEINIPGAPFSIRTLRYRSARNSFIIFEHAKYTICTMSSGVNFHVTPVVCHTFLILDWDGLSDRVCNTLPPGGLADRGRCGKNIGVKYPIVQELVN